MDKWWLEPPSRSLSDNFRCCLASVSRQRCTGRGSTAGAPRNFWTFAAPGRRRLVRLYFNISLENAPKLQRVRALPPTMIDSPSATV